MKLKKLLTQLLPYVFIVVFANIGLSCYLFVKIYSFSEYPLMWIFSLLGAAVLVWVPLAYAFSNLYDKIIEIIRS